MRGCFMVPEEEDEAERRSLSEEKRVSEVRAEMPPDDEEETAVVRCSEQARVMVRRIRAEAVVRLRVVVVMLDMRWLGCVIECVAPVETRR